MAKRHFKIGIPLPKRKINQMGNESPLFQQEETSKTKQTDKFGYLNKLCEQKTEKKLSRHQTSQNIFPQIQKNQIYQKQQLSNQTDAQNSPESYSPTQIYQTPHHQSPLSYQVTTPVNTQQFQSQQNSSPNPYQRLQNRRPSSNTKIKNLNQKLKRIHSENEKNYQQLLNTSSRLQSANANQREQLQSLNPSSHRGPLRLVSPHLFSKRLNPQQESSQNSENENTLNYEINNQNQKASQKFIQDQKFMLKTKYSNFKQENNKVSNISLQNVKQEMPKSCQNYRPKQLQYDFDEQFGKLDLLYGNTKIKIDQFLDVRMDLIKLQNTVLKGKG